MKKGAGRRDKVKEAELRFTEAEVHEPFRKIVFYSPDKSQAAGEQTSTSPKTKAECEVFHLRKRVTLFCIKPGILKEERFFNFYGHLRDN